MTPAFEVALARAQWFHQFMPALASRNYKVSFDLTLYQLKMDIAKFLASSRNDLARIYHRRYRFASVVLE